MSLLEQMLLNGSWELRDEILTCDSLAQAFLISEITESKFNIHVFNESRVRRLPEHTGDFVAGIGENLSQMAADEACHSGDQQAWTGLVFAFIHKVFFS